MASQMIVPASKDTLFMRGFSARQEIEDIREFFNRDGGGRCTVEFFKESDDKTKLYLALKFDSKDVAKDLINKYDNTVILGDKVTISWFKDLRRARMKAGNRGRRFWSPDRYNDYGRKDRYHNVGRYGNRWNNFGTRGRKFDRSSSRSRSRSSSRSRSRSLSPRRSRSRSSDSHGGKRKKSRTTSESRKDRRKRSLEKDRSRDRASRERSPSVGRHSREDSLDRDDIVDDNERPESRQSAERSPALRNIKIVRSAVTTVERSSRDGAASDDESDEEHASYGRRLLSEDEADKHPSDSHRKPDKMEPRDRPIKDIPEPRGRAFKDAAPSGDLKEDPAPFEQPIKEREVYREPEPPKDMDVGEEAFYQRRRYERDMSPLPSERPPQGPRYTEKPFREQDYRGNFDRIHRSVSPPGRGDEPLHSSRDPERGAPPGGDYNEPGHRDRDLGYGYRPPVRDTRPDPRYTDNVRELPVNTPPPMVRGRPVPHPDTRDIRSPPLHDDMSPDGRLRPKRVYDDDMPVFERKLARDRDYEDMRAPPIRRDPEDLMDTKRRRYIDEAPVPLQRDMWRRDEYYDDRPRPGPTAAPPPGPRLHRDERERSPYFDDRGSTGTPATRNHGNQGSFNGGMSREVEKGTLGLAQDKMALVKERKDEIEKSYRQDCETFAAVTKMLISKDNSLEDRLQSSLRENLKDIGQRCIHELREFIEHLKMEDDRRPMH